MKTKTKQFTVWELLAIETSVRHAVETGSLDKHSGEDLLNKISRAVTINYKVATPQSP